MELSPLVVAAAAAAPTSETAAMPASEALVGGRKAVVCASDGGSGALPAWAMVGITRPAVPTSAEVMRKWRQAINDCCADMLFLPVPDCGRTARVLDRGESN